MVDHDSFHDFEESLGVSLQKPIGSELEMCCNWSMIVAILGGTKSETSVMFFYFFYFFFYLLKPDPSRNGANCGVVWWWG